MYRCKNLCGLHFFFYAQSERGDKNRIVAFLSWSLLTSYVLTESKVIFFLVSFVKHSLRMLNDTVHRHVELLCLMLQSSNCFIFQSILTVSYSLPDNARTSNSKKTVVVDFFLIVMHKRLVVLFLF